MIKKILIITALSSVSFFISQGQIISKSLNTEIQKQDSSEILIEGEQPAFSPDGKKIAYVFEGNIWLLDLPTMQRRKIGHFFNANAPAWSPDGRRIVFQCYGRRKSKDHIFQIWVMNSDGTNPLRLRGPASDRSFVNQYPRYSPDGKSIIWTHGNQLWIMDSDGKNGRPLTQSPAKIYEYICDFSPDNQNLVFIRGESAYDIPPFGKIWLIRLNGENQKIFREGIKADYVKWSKDGKSLYYSAGTSLWKVSVNNTDSAVKVFESNLERGLNFFDISQDEKLIAFEDPDRGKFFLKRVNFNSE